MADVVPTARATPHVRLVPMTDEERDAVLRGQVSGYADAKTRAGIWPAEESLARAQAEIGALLGPRPRDRGHEFFVARDEEGRRVGWLWLGPVPSTEPSRNARWVFQIEVDEPLRGRGFGRGLLRAAEDHVRWSGYEEIALNVFRWNASAVALYSSSGYETVSQDEAGMEMRKRLRPP